MLAQPYKLLEISDLIIIVIRISPKFKQGLMNVTEENCTCKHLLNATFVVCLCMETCLHTLSIYL